MKKFFVTLTVFCSVLVNAFAQNLINKVPATSSMVIKYASTNFSTLVPIKKVDTYNFVKKEFFKAINLDTLTSVQSTGINFEKDTYQYVTLEDSSVSFVTLLHLQNVSQFLKLLDANYHAEMKPLTKNGYQFLAMSPTTYIGWNNETAVWVVSNYDNPNNNYYAYGNNNTVTTEAVVMEAVKAPVEEMQITDTLVPTKPKVKTTKPKTGTKKTTTAKKKTTKPKTKKVEAYDEVKTYPYKMTYADSLENEKREAFYKEQEKVTAARQKKVASVIIENTLNGVISSIENDASYKTLVDTAAHVSLWLNNDALITNYWSSMYGGMRYFLGRGFNNLQYKSSASNDGLKTGMNLYFDKEKIRLQSKSFTPDASMDKLSKSVFDSKQNMALTSFINPDNMGYLSMSINSEAMQHYYYKWIKDYLKSNPYSGEFSDMVDVYVDLLEIVIDEKGIAALAPGNYMFVLHDMKTVPVTYTDYVYDDNFKGKQVVKTKQELSPNFTFVMETQREDFVQKIVNLPLKYAKKEHFKYEDKGGYFEYTFDSSSNSVIPTLYFIVKDGKFMVTTSKISVDIALNKATAFTLNDETKNSILNNNYALNVNGKKVSQAFGYELNSNVNKKINNYIQENVGNLKMESGIKDGMIQSNTTFNFYGNHSNGLEFIFNLVEGINDIIEKDKIDSKKINN